MRRLNILTWHVHGNYLFYLSQAPHEFYVPFREDRSGDYLGAAGNFPWPPNVHEVPAEAVRALPLDCILFQRLSQYREEQFRILSAEQLALPRIYLEHDPPQEHPTNTRHPVDDPAVLLVHVTPFNRLMWDSGSTPSIVIDHGVLVPENARYSGERECGITVVNNIKKRGRRLGADVLEYVRREVPIDLVGMGAAEAGGFGEVSHGALPLFESRYRFFFNPIRYTSLGLAVCEAMMIGMPVVGLASTEMATAVKNGVSGFVDTDLDLLIGVMKALLKDPAEARRLGEGARRYAVERFNIRRFIRDWNSAFALVAGTRARTTAPFASLGNSHRGE
ncbi:MAG: glycosyltransferase [Endomicrobiales bacterium]